MTTPLPPKETEGVVKYHLDFTPALAPEWPLLAELDAWRTVLFELGLTGCDPRRYGGLAYGNVSRRLAGRQFLISGTQTGQRGRLSSEHYCLVTDYDCAGNLLVAEGPIQPSSEALTHAAAYQAADSLNCVLHVHSPLLWQHAEPLAIPMTPAQAAYGTPAMAAAVKSLFVEPGIRIIAMGGHRDGLIAAGESPESAALTLIRSLAGAIRLDRAETQGSTPRSITEKGSRADGPAKSRIFQDPPAGRHPG